MDDNNNEFQKYVGQRKNLRSRINPETIGLNDLVKDITDEVAQSFALEHCKVTGQHSGEFRERKPFEAILKKGADSNPIDNLKLEIDTNNNINLRELIDPKAIKVDELADILHEEFKKPLETYIIGESFAQNNSSIAIPGYYRNMTRDLGISMLKSLNEALGVDVAEVSNSYQAGNIEEIQKIIEDSFNKYSTHNVKPR